MQFGEKCNHKTDCYCGEHHTTTEKVITPCAFVNSHGFCEDSSKFVEKSKPGNCGFGELCYKITSIEGSECVNRVLKKGEVCETGGCGCGEVASGTLTEVCPQGTSCNQIKNMWFCGHDLVDVGKSCDQEKGCTCHDSASNNRNFLQMTKGDTCHIDSEKMLGFYSIKIKPNDVCQNSQCLCEGKINGQNFDRFIQQNEICKVFSKKLVSVNHQLDAWGFCEKGFCFCDSKNPETSKICSKKETCGLKDGVMECVGEKIKPGQYCDPANPVSCYCVGPIDNIERHGVVPREMFCLPIGQEFQGVKALIFYGVICNTKVCACSNDFMRDNSVPVRNVICKEFEMCLVENSQPKCLKVETMQEKQCDKPECVCQQGNVVQLCKQGETCILGPAHGCYKSTIKNGEECKIDGNCYCYDNPKDKDGKDKPYVIAPSMCKKGMVCLFNLLYSSSACVLASNIGGIGMTSKTENFGCKIFNSKANIEVKFFCKPNTFCAVKDDFPACVGLTLKSKEICPMGDHIFGPAGTHCICKNPAKPDKATICDPREQCYYEGNELPYCFQNMLFFKEACFDDACSCVGEPFETFQETLTAKYKAATCQKGQRCYLAPMGNYCASFLLSKRFTSNEPTGFVCLLFNKYLNTHFSISCLQYQTCVQKDSFSLVCEETKVPFVIRDGERCSNKRAGCECTSDNKNFAHCLAAEVCRATGKPKCEKDKFEYFHCLGLTSCHCGPMAIRHSDKNQFCYLHSVNSYLDKPLDPTKVYSNQLVRSDILKRMIDGKHILYDSVKKRSLKEDTLDQQPGEQTWPQVKIKI